MIVTIVTAYEHVMISEISSFLQLPKEVTSDLFSLIITPDTTRGHYFYSQRAIPLFNRYPILYNHLSYIELADLPTPIEKLPNLARLYAVPHLYIKRDDLTGKDLGNDVRLFGGNKVRKLEFLLADALAHQAPSVVTFGCAGSNHATATALYCQELGIPCTVMLKPQHNNHIVQRNLLLNLYAQAEIIFSPTTSLRACATASLLSDTALAYGKFPYVFPTGGSNARGALGYVNAAFELQEQIAQGAMPMPDRIYLPLASAGTIAGLLLGLKATGIQTKVYGITVEPGDSASFMNTVQHLFDATNQLLQSLDPQFPTFTCTPHDITIVTDFAGEEYALFTQEAMAAIKKMNEQEKILLDGVYSGKAFAALLYDLQQRSIKKGEVVLFWNTFHAGDCQEFIADLDYTKLPWQFHDYFVTDVQPLDQVTRHLIG
jgi:D-cysteine desulfhydrase